MRWAAGCCGRRGAGGWAAEDFSGIAVLGLAAAYAAALVVHGNRFVATFRGALAVGATAGRHGPAELCLTGQAGALLTLLVWLAFGALAVPVLLDQAAWTTVLYAVLSLTVIRMVPPSRWPPSERPWTAGRCSSSADSVSAGLHLCCSR